MSKWRDDICGSEIHSKESETEGRRLLLNGPSEVLSCGGNFLPNPATPRQKKADVCIHLPKNSYEVLFLDDEDSWVHYGAPYLESEDDLDYFDDMLLSSDAK